MKDDVDNYLRSLVFRDGQLSLQDTTFLEVSCRCGAKYATRVSLFQDATGATVPACDRAIEESKATCHICGLPLSKADAVAMYTSLGFGIKLLKGKSNAQV